MLSVRRVIVPDFSIDEAKLVADVLQTTFPKIEVAPPKRGHWLNHLARAEGYRDWNAMAARAPAQPPDMRFGEWCDAFYAIAWVEVPGREGTFVMLRTRDWQVAHPRTGWPAQLADQVRRLIPFDFTGISFDYRRGELKQCQDAEWWTPAGGPHPVVATAPGDAVRILLWWLKDRYSAGRNLASNFIPHYRLHFDSTAYGNEPCTDQFLRRLTGVARPRRTCLYRTEEPNAPGGLYLPVLVTEEEPAGTLAPGWQAGDWETVGKRVCDANREAGLTRYDMAEIAQRFAYFEPKTPEDIVDFDGIYE